MLVVICMSKRDRKIRARSAVTEHPRSSAQQRRITTTTVSQVHVWLTNDTQYLAWLSQQGILSKCQDSESSPRMCVSCGRGVLHEIRGHSCKLHKSAMQKEITHQRANRLPLNAGVSFNHSNCMENLMHSEMNVLWPIVYSARLLKPYSSLQN